MPRVEIKKSDIARVAELAQVCVRAVRHYRDGLPVLRSTAAVIERAAATLPQPQGELFAGAQPAESPALSIPGPGGIDIPVVVDPNLSSYGPPWLVPVEYTNDVRPRSEPLVIGVPLSPERVARLNAEAQRCHVTVLDERGQVIRP